ncbi:MAG: magnesium/cobalt transporter CorA [Candidatus Cloacimonetes bacterium]|nr:magnesium/cobalt transporter CorA [Candidatus Cloacimonadota bacterium]
MSKQVKKLHSRAGSVPGSLIHIGTRKAEHVRISVIDYDSENLEEKILPSIDQIYPYLDTESVSWINIDGLHDTDVFAELGEKLDLHPLLLEDVLDTSQRPKIDNYGKHLFIIMKMVTWDEKEKTLEFEQVSFILGDNYIISVQEHIGDIFENVRQRIRNDRSRIRKMGIDYLLYALLDAAVDCYFLLLNNLGDQIENIEDELVLEPGPEILATIHHLKRDILVLRKSVWHLRPVIANLYREDYGTITTEVQTFLRDLHDNTIQVIDTIETYRDMISGMMDIYLSSISNRMNQVMKVLTIFAAIFIPLTFFAGVYGMNFNFMPELDWKWAYPVWWLLIIVITVIMILFFKKKKWL